MSLPNLKALRKPVSGCNNSSPRSMRETHYAAILAQQKVSQVFKLQDTHNVSFIFPNVMQPDGYTPQR